MNNIQIPEKVAKILLAQETVEFMAKPEKRAYRKQTNLYLRNAFILLFFCAFPFLSLISISLLFTEWFLSISNLENTHIIYNIFGSWMYLVVILSPILLFFFLALLSGAYRSRKSYKNSFYAYTNMRVIFNEASKVKFFYFKDIHEVKIKKRHKVMIDINEYTGDYSDGIHKRLYSIMGVQDAENFVKNIDQKLLPFRLGPQ